MVVNNSMVCPLVKKCKRAFLHWKKSEIVDYIIEKSTCEELVDIVREYEDEMKRKRKTICQ